MRKFHFYAALAAIAAILAATSCDDDEQIGQSGDWLFGRSETMVKGAETATFKLSPIVAGDAWQADVRFEGEATGWLTLDQTNGEAGAVSLSVTLKANTAKTSRSATVTIRCHDDELLFGITQQGAADTPDDGEDDEKPAVSRISRLTLTYYDGDMRRAYEESLTLTYSGSSLSGAVCKETDAEEKTATTYIDIERQGESAIAYSFRTEGEAEETVEAQLGNGRYSKLGQLEFSYLDDNLYFVKKPDESVWTFSWGEDGNIMSIGGDAIDKTLKFRMSEFALSENVNLNAIIVFCLHEKGNLRYAVFAENGNWGNHSTRLIDRIEEESTIFTYNPALDAEKKRISKVMEYRRVGSITPTLVKALSVEYAE